ncbi:ABC transporter substrate-binding protein [Paenibacillus sambharensis]|uniref:ABC transporter substrate-binding protein n=1 Tax=Paenibacillus sambharensis TaxID=1803190 RepID=UPI0015E8E65E|nr:ABC transporter substrate-binding protein [Paenibacillus sambharensis]
MNRTTKLTMLACLFLLFSVLAACGGGGNNAGNTAGNTGANTPAEGNQAAGGKEGNTQESATKVYKDGLDKEVEVPVNPQRIVALHNVGELLALGVKPLGTTDYHLNKYDPEKVAGVESVGESDPNMEKLVELEPDLIIVSSYFTPEVIAGLEKIAPVVATKWGLTPTEHLDALADLLGKEEEKQAWLDAYAAKVESVKAKIGQYAGEKAVVLQFWEKTIYRHSPTVFASLYEAGFVAPEQAAAVTQTEAISEEAVVDFAADADRLFLLVEDPSNKDRYNELKGTAWKDIPAVQKDQVHLVDTGRWNDYSASAMMWILEDLEAMFGNH